MSNNFTALRSVLTSCPSIAIIVCLLGAPAEAAPDGTDAPPATDRVGLGDFGQTTVLSNLFNPAFSFTGDFLFSWSEKDGREAGADGFDLRSAEVGIHGAVDDLIEYSGVIHFGEDEVELEEAYAVARDWLPGRFSLRGGRFNLDFGKQNPIHDHDLLTVERPSVLQEFLGGSLRGTGVELDWWSPVGEASLVRFSGALLESAEGDAHSVLGPAAGHGHDEEEDAEGPIREIEDLALNLRGTGLIDFEDESTLQFGASYLFAPTRVFGVDETDERDLDQGVLGLDLTYTRTDERTGSGIFLQGEWLYGDSEFGELDDNGTPAVTADDTFTVTRSRSQGFYGLAEWRMNREWAFGVSGSSYEHAEDSAEDSWDAGVHATWKPSEFHRLRLGVHSYEDLVLEDEGVETLADFVAVQLQWTVILGSHGHGVDW